MKQLTLILLLLFTQYIFAQKRETVFTGRVKSDSTFVENIHIFNKTSKKGTISNLKGEFEIAVELNDTLLFSGIQYYLIELEITKQILKEKYLEINLLQKINTLSEVEVKAHDLFGNLFIDSKNFKDTLVEANTSATNFGNIDFKVPSKFVADQLDPDKMPDVTDPMIPVGLDLMPVVNLLKDQIKKIGQNKRDIKIQNNIYKKKVIDAHKEIRTEIGDDFFMYTLDISTEQIDTFIIFCEAKGLIDLFLKNKKIEMIDLLLKESEIFKNN